MLNLRYKKVKYKSIVYSVSAVGDSNNNKHNWTLWNRKYLAQCKINDNLNTIRNEEGPALCISSVQLGSAGKC